MRFLTAVASMVAVLALAVAPVLAQSQAPAPPSATPRPAPAMPEKAPEKAKEVEGTVKKVDPATKSVQVSSGLLGIFGATLEVTDQTKINVLGKDGSLADIREGARVKASYESRDGKNVAKSIDVMAAEEKPQQAAPRPATPGAASPGATPPSATQPGSQQPKTQ